MSGLLDEVEAIRRMNNSLWMDILWIALNFAPDPTKDRLKKINENDEDVTSLLRQIAND